MASSSKSSLLWSQRPHVNYQTINRDLELQQQQHDDEPTIDNKETRSNRGLGNNWRRWDHIANLDKFFTHVYKYHQERGFVVMAAGEILRLVQFVFVMGLISFLKFCINYDILFGYQTPAHDHTQVTIIDAILPMNEWLNNVGHWTVFLFAVGFIIFVVRVLTMICHLHHYWDIKQFYNTVLKIDDGNLENVTWHEIKAKVKVAQTEHNMCIEKNHITDLDIYQRILRSKNFLVSLMNKNLIPMRLGNMVMVPKALLLNIELILFCYPASPFKNKWHLRDEYLVRGNQAELAKEMSNLILLVAVINILLLPFIFVWQLISYCFYYVNVMKNDPGKLSLHTWSNYGRLQLRHFNELDHELDARLNRAYEYGRRYLETFTSPLSEVIGKTLLFISGGVVLSLGGLGIFNEHVFQMGYVLPIITAFSVLGIIAYGMLPDENLDRCPEKLMTAILSHVHYIPSSWKNRAHTTHVRTEFVNYFQSKLVYCLIEMFSPIITPLLLLTYRKKSLEIVNFFKNFTVSVTSVGDVCAFAQMNIQKHGDPEWQAELPESSKNKAAAANNGKTELSLIRFSSNNPEWQVPAEGLNFIKTLKKRALTDLKKATTTTTCSNAATTSKQKDYFTNSNPLMESLIAFGTVQDKYSSVAEDIAQNLRTTGKGEHTTRDQYSKSNFQQMLQQSLGTDQSQLTDSFSSALSNVKKLRVSKLEGSIHGPSQQQSLIYGLHGRDSLWKNNPTDLTVADINLSVLYLHKLHDKTKKSSSEGQSVAIEIVPDGNRSRNIKVPDTILTIS